MSHLFVNLFQFPTGDMKKHSGAYPTGMETQFLIDTGATCSVINYPTFQQLSYLQPLTVVQSQRTTRAVNGTKVSMIGYCEITSNFDSEGKLPVKHVVWISKKTGCRMNLLGMDFISQVSDSLEFRIPLIHLKLFPGQVVLLKTASTKDFPHYAKIQPVVLPDKLYISQNQLRMIKVELDNNQTFKPGAVFNPHYKLKKTGLFFFDSYSPKPETKFPILIDNSQNHAVTLPSGSIGYISQDKVIHCQKNYSIQNYSAFLYRISVDDTLQEEQIHYSAMPTWVEEMKLPDVPTTSEKHNFCESLTLKTIVKTENTDTDQMINQITEAFPFRNNPETDELATDFSQEEKECRPKTPSSTETPIRGKFLPKTILNNFTPD